MPIETAAREAQLRKAPAPSVPTLSGMAASVKLLQLENAYAPIVARLSGRSSSRSALLEKAVSPMVARELGNVTEVKLRAP